MMTIEGVLRSRGPEMDLFAPEFFSGVSKITFDKFEKVYVYGYHTVNQAVVAVVIRSDLTGLTELPLSRDKYDKLVTTVDVTEAWIDKDPPIPPEYGRTSESVIKDMWELRSRYLAQRSVRTPKYISIDQDVDDIQVVDNQDVFNRAPNDTLIIQNRSGIFNYDATIAFCNGLCCFPTVVKHDVAGSALALDSGSHVRHNQKDRDGSIILVDFGEFGKVDCVRLSEMEGDWYSGLKVPNRFNLTDCSFLLSVAGRIFVPGEFNVFADRNLLFFDPTKFMHEYTLDEAVCKNEFTVKGGRVVDVNVTDGRTARNSFLIIIRNPNMKVIEHHAQTLTNESQFMSRWTSGVAMHQVIYPACCAGLMFDRSTRSVREYTKESHDMQSYTSKSTIPVVWRKVLARVKHATCMEILPRNSNNLMLARAIMHDRLTITPDARVLYPSFSMLDFIFKG